MPPLVDPPVDDDPPPLEDDDHDDAQLERDAVAADLALGYAPADYDFSAAGRDDSDLDGATIFGEQSTHNYPDVHRDWGDATVCSPGPASGGGGHGGRGRAAACEDARAGAWNSEYRAQLEAALAMVQDSKDVMSGLKKLRTTREKARREGEVEMDEKKGQTALEAERDWVETREEELARLTRTKRSAIEEEKRAIKNAEKERLVGALPEFIARRNAERGGGMDAVDGSVGEDAMRELIAGHKEWLSSLGAEERELAAAREKFRAKAAKDAAAAAAAAAEEDSISRDAPGTPPWKREEVGGADPGAESGAESGADDLDDEDDELERSFGHAIPSSKTPPKLSRDVDFWSRDVYGADDVDGELDAFEKQMAEMCALDIENARRAKLEAKAAAEE